MAEACTGMQVGRENPSELKAAKLARGMARGVEDRDLKPNTQERQQIEVVIVGPPNRHAPSHCTGHDVPWRCVGQLTTRCGTMPRKRQCVGFDQGDLKLAGGARFLRSHV